MKETTKICPKCGGTCLVHYSSIGKKQCADCYKWLDWHLENGQEPLLGPARKVAKHKPNS